MPHKGQFVANGSGDTYKYETDKWRRLGTENWIADYRDSRHVTTDIDEVVLKITKPDGEVQYQTAVGPFESWEWVEVRILAHDWGEEGSRGKA
jgi:hypothetical protein